MTHRAKPTSIVFPRISNRDGPAKTLYKEDFIDPSLDPNNPLFDPLRYGFSDDTTLKVNTKRVLITLDAPNPRGPEHRTAQRFSSNYKKPDSETKRLIRTRRGL